MMMDHQLINLINPINPVEVMRAEEAPAVRMKGGSEEVRK